MRGVEHVREEGEKVIVHGNDFTPRRNALARGGPWADRAVGLDHHLHLPEAVPSFERLQASLHLATSVCGALESEQGLALLEEVEGGIDLPLLIEQLPAGVDLGRA